MGFIRLSHEKTARHSRRHQFAILSDLGADEIYFCDHKFIFNMPVVAKLRNLRVKKLCAHDFESAPLISTNLMEKLTPGSELIITNLSRLFEGLERLFEFLTYTRKRHIKLVVADQNLNCGGKVTFLDAAIAIHEQERIAIRELSLQMNNLGRKFMNVGQKPLTLAKLREVAQLIHDSHSTVYKMCKSKDVGYSYKLLSKWKMHHPLPRQYYRKLTDEQVESNDRELAESIRNGTYIPDSEREAGLLERNPTLHSNLITNGGHNCA